MIIGLAAVLVTTGCAATSPSPEASPSAAVSATSDILTRTLPADVTARGVVLAAVLLTVGKIENAVADGTVTPAEVDEAMKAVADGTVDLWRQRADADR